MTERTADPRPRVEQRGGDWLVAGMRCSTCGYPVAGTAARCPACRSTGLEPAAFGPAGTVWAGTVLHVDASDRRAPWALAYVDVEDGPRVLAHVVGAVAPPPGAAVRLTGVTVEGDPLVEVVA